MPSPRLTSPIIPTIRAAAAANVVSFLERHGIAPKDVFASLDIQIPSVWDPYASIPLPAFTELLEICALETEIPHAGLQLGYEQDPANWGALGFVLLNAPTIWSCLDCMEQFFQPWQAATHVKAGRDKEHLYIEYAIRHPSVKRRDQDAELSISFAVNLIRRMSRGKVNPVYVSFMHKQIADLSEYSRFLGITPVFETDMNAIYFEKKFEGVENTSADERLYYIVKKHLTDLTCESAEPENLADAIKDIIRIKLTGKTPSLTSVSKSLAMQARTLQRRLEESDLSFSEIIKEVRLEEADRYLTGTTMEVKEISYFLGFSDPSAFIKAFKRWTGVTPQKYREQNAGRLNLRPSALPP